MEASTLALIVQAIWPIVTALIVLCFTLLSFGFALRSRVKAIEVEQHSHKTDDQEKLSQARIDLIEVKVNSDKNMTLLWSKIEALQSTMNDLRQAFGRLEGKIEAKSH